MEELNTVVLVRTLVYASLFIGFVLVFLPARLLSWAGLALPASLGAAQVIGLIVGLGGAALAIWCVATFALVGKGTPAPFDPPRRLVVRGPYRVVRNPMYLGAALALAGAGLFYESLPLVGYAAVFVVLTHLFVVSYEEPVLRRTFGADYDAYCQRIRRWWPTIPKARAR